VSSGHHTPDNIRLIVFRADVADLAGMEVRRAVALGPPGASRATPARTRGSNWLLVSGDRCRVRAVIPGFRLSGSRPPRQRSPPGGAARSACADLGPGIHAPGTWRLPGEDGAEMWADRAVVLRSRPRRAGPAPET